ncbi:acetyl-CoA C-acyltransferase [Saprospira grandis]|uniref:acetyl-CoA C-acyltransferase n=1 Tax=Saprospira grandis TaxID=1008 RepID=UPI0022DD1ABC|nr:acetyl-CoA C-acyltransferase [Saprospira grandis]WBM75187.1 acetyl-CoA C-acyltransferase [Saprospira grandis]
MTTKIDVDKMQNVFIYAASRTPRAAGQNSGPLQEIKPIQLLDSSIQAVLKAQPTAADYIGDLFLGCMTPVGEQGGNIARAAALYAGLPYQVAGTQINRFCASGLEALQMAAAKIELGWEQLVLAGGLESMNRVPELSDGGAMIYDPLVRAAVNFVPPSLSADLLANLQGFSRQELDEYSFEMHQRALKSQAAKWLRHNAALVYDQNGLPILEKNECLRHGLKAEDMAQFAPILSEKEAKDLDVMALMRYPSLEYLEHLHTPASAAQLADGSAMALIGNAQIGEQLGLKARAKILSAKVVAVDPTLSCTAGLEAVKQLLAQTGLNKNDIELWEKVELFAAVGLHFTQALDIPLDQYNIFGSDIAWGYAAGAMGGIALANLLDGLEKEDKQLGCIAISARAGLGAALLVERV